ncbi:MAG: wax ester/triacylglycerol synthase family O-acyltransferase [Caldilineaceae bacterium]
MANTNKPMSPVDAAWYHIDGPVNLAQVTGILLTQTPLDFARVKEIYSHRLRPFERFRQRVVESGFPIATPHWEDMHHFDIDQHVHHIALPAPHDQAALMNLISDLASTPLDHAHPLWQVHVVDNVEGGGALIMRFHHCIGDGTAMMALSQELFDETPDAPLDRTQPTAHHPEAGLLDRLLGTARHTVERTTRLAVSTVQSGLDSVQHPEGLLEKAGIAVGAAGMLVSELLKSSDPKSPLKGDFGLEKRVAWSEPVPLDQVKAIGAQFGAKINDVLVAGVTGALRTYLAKRGADVDHNTLRSMVPVDLRPRGQGLNLGNEFGLVILELAVNQANPLERLRITKAHMDRLKRSPEALAILTLFNIFGRGPKLLEDIAVQLFGSKASLVLTNVAGPRQTLYIAGAPIDRMMFWVPHPGKELGMGISILSYNGVVSLAVISDAHLVPDPEAIAQAFSAEFAKMVELVQSPPAVAEKPAPAVRLRCTAQTKKGQPCKNWPVAGTHYCRVHQPKASA